MRSVVNNLQPVLVKSRDQQLTADIAGQFKFRNTQAHGRVHHKQPSKQSSLTTFLEQTAIKQLVKGTEMVDIELLSLQFVSKPVLAVHCLGLALHIIALSLGPVLQL